MRILWTLPYFPWPVTSGGKSRQYHLIKGMAERGHQITLLVQTKTMPSQNDRAQLAPFVEQQIILPRRPLCTAKTLTASLLPRYPLLVAANGFSSELGNQFTALLKQPWDIIQIEHSYAFQPYAKELHSHPFILTEHNIESSLGDATYNRFPNWLKPLLRFDQKRMRHWEKYAWGQAEQVVATTEEDSIEISHFSRFPCAVVFNGVDISHFSTVEPDYAQGSLLYIGNFEYAPNREAVEWLLTDIMPLVWQHFPRLRLQIGGYATPENWIKRWADKRIHWLGFIKDLRTVQQNTAIFIAPLRHGGGSKLKVLEAMAAALPVISTGQGTSGLRVADGTHYMHAETPHEFYKAVHDLVSNSTQAQRIGQAGREYALQHDWSRAAEKLEQVYMEFNARNAHRH